MRSPDGDSEAFRPFVSKRPAPPEMMTTYCSYWFDTSCGVEHPSDVLTISRQLTALALVLPFVIGNAAVCAGWATSPEARMACCSVACPMHQPGSHGSGSAAPVGQAEADSCCASSEQSDPAPSAPGFTPPSSVAQITSAIPAIVPQARPIHAAWRSLVPVPGTRVAKHLLLSVLLV